MGIKSVITQHEIGEINVEEKLASEYLNIAKALHPDQTIEQFLLKIENFFITLGLKRIVYLVIPPESYFDNNVTNFMSVGPVNDAMVTAVLDGLRALENRDSGAKYYNIRSLETFKPFFGQDPNLKKLGVYDDGSQEERYRAFPGMIYPVFEGRMCHGLFGIITREDTTDTLQARMLQNVFQMIHEKYCETFYEDFVPPIVLSKRERDVLNWLRLGKSNGAISQILGISQHTVDTYTRRIYKKLGVSDRVSASIKATMLGLLSMQDI